jgi:LPS-assembly protein
LFGGWYGVGRYNYSLEESRVIETIGGLEYNAGCWVGRFVLQRQAVIADSPTTAVFFQLELNDFSKIGSNPLNLLRRNIPGYGMINQPTADPVFAEN